MQLVFNTQDVVDVEEQGVGGARPPGQQAIRDERAIGVSRTGPQVNASRLRVSLRSPGLLWGDVHGAGRWAFKGEVGLQPTSSSFTSRMPTWMPFARTCRNT